MSQRTAKEGRTLMRTAQRPDEGWPTARAAAAICCSAGPTSAKNCCPSAVSVTWRMRRSNSGTPRNSSSRRICRLTALCVTCSSTAARVKLSCRAAAAKARTALRGGSRDEDMRAIFSRMPARECRLSERWAAAHHRGPMPTAPAPHRPELAPRRDRAGPRAAGGHRAVSAAADARRAIRPEPRRGRPPAGGQPPGAHRRLRLGGAFLRPPRRPPRLHAGGGSGCPLRPRLRAALGLLGPAAAATPVGAVLRGTQPVDAGAGDGGPGGRRPPQRSLAGLHRDGPGARAAAGRAARAGHRAAADLLRARGGGAARPGRCAAAAFAAASRGGAGAALSSPRQPRCLVLHGRAHAGRALHRRPLLPRPRLAARRRGGGGRPADGPALPGGDPPEPSRRAPGRQAGGRAPAGDPVAGHGAGAGGLRRGLAVVLRGCDRGAARAAIAAAAAHRDAAHAGPGARPGAGGARRVARHRRRHRPAARGLLLPLAPPLWLYGIPALLLALAALACGRTPAPAPSLLATPPGKRSP